MSHLSVEHFVFKQQILSLTCDTQFFYQQIQGRKVEIRGKNTGHCGETLCLVIAA